MITRGHPSLPERPGLTTVELFAGIGGFRVAADAAGLRTVWANDINPKSCKVYRDNFGARELHEGNIADLLLEVPSHDILTAGFPCQPFSSAGKKQGIRDPRGTLFQVIIQVLERLRPTFFVLENVKRLLSMESGSHFATILQSLTEAGYWVEWRLVAATDFGLPQNRQRVLLVGTRLSALSEHSGPAVKLTKPSELKGEFCTQLLPIPSRWTRFEAHKTKFSSWGIAANGGFVCGHPHTFMASKHLPPLASFLETDPGHEFDFTDATKDRIKQSTYVGKFVGGVKILYNQGGGARMGYTVFGVDGIAPALTATASRHYERYEINGRYRRLTNTEYARLQGFRDRHCQCVSVYDQYELFGNAIPPPIARWGISKVMSEGISVTMFSDTSQLLPLSYA